VPARLRPTAPIAAGAVLVGDPGRALMLAQELLVQPKMSNHARGLWGYWGETAAGEELTVQSTGMGGPSAALVLADLAELGVRRAVRVGTCTALGSEPALGTLAVVEQAHARPESGSLAAAAPDRALTAALREELGAEAVAAAVASLDALPQLAAEIEPGEVADMQTAALLARGAGLGVALAVALIVTASLDGAHLDDESTELVAKAAGAAAATVLST
jgi:nucleoside phosphorylase